MSDYMTPPHSRPKALTRAIHHSASLGIALAGAALMSANAQAPAPVAAMRPPMGDPAYEAQRDAERLQAIKEYGQRAGRDLGARMQATEKACGKAGRAAPYIGAHTSWVLACATWGKPNRTHTLTTAAGHTQTWAYDLHGFLHFDHAGQLRTIQSR